MNVAVLITSVLLGALGQVFLKWGVSPADEPAGGTGAVAGLLRALSSWPLWAGLAAYGFSLLLWLFALKKFPLSTAYPMVSLGYIVVMAAGAIFFQETVSVQKWVGVGLISCGVIFIARS
ncbi:SMR family transporter [Paenibacillus sp. GYB004]|uniref:SMR family transporter n=1 Tax=Paenibacillus sp. GYB004 TaxID=2994393 RepID=UPI002F966C45